MPLTFAGLILATNLGLRDYPAVILGTIFVVLACWIFFEGVRRTRVTRFLFGIKERKTMELNNPEEPPETI